MNLVDFNGTSFRNMLDIQSVSMKSETTSPWILFENTTYNSIIRVHGTVYSTGPTQNATFLDIESFAGSTVPNLVDTDDLNRMLNVGTYGFAASVFGSNTQLCTQTIKEVPFQKISATTNLYAYQTGTVFLVGPNATSTIGITLHAPTPGAHQKFYFYADLPGGITANLFTQGNAAVLFKPGLVNVGATGIFGFITNGMALCVWTDGSAWYIDGISGDLTGIYSVKTIPFTAAAASTPTQLPSGYSVYIVATGTGGVILPVATWQPLSIINDTGASLAVYKGDGTTLAATIANATPAAAAKFLYGSNVAGGGINNNFYTQAGF